MSNSGIVIPNEINKILSERASLWAKLDQAQSQFKEMEGLSSQVASSNPSQILPELTDEKTPHSEIAASLQNFQSELARINKGKESISAYQAEIKRIETQQLITVIVVGVIIAIVLCAIVFGGISFLNSLMS